MYMYLARVHAVRGGKIYENPRTNPENVENPRGKHVKIVLRDMNMQHGLHNACDVRDKHAR